MATSDEFDREIEEATRRYVRGEVSKDEFESLKKEIVSHHLKRVYDNKVGYAKVAPLNNKLSGKNKGGLLLLILFIVSLSTYALVSNIAYQAPQETGSNEEMSIVEKIVSIPKAIIANEPVYTIPPIDKALRDDKSKHIFTSNDFTTVPNNIINNLPLSSMRGMGMNSFGLDGAEGVVDLSVVKEGYAIYPSKSSDGSEVYITLFLVEQGKQNKFFRELSTYIGSFDTLRKDYKKEGDVVSTELSSVQCRYSLKENSNRYPVLVTSFKSSNIAGFIYYLDPRGVFSLQGEIEKSVKSVLNSYE
ncbi:MAG: SHOCT domain-containing protein [Candidatus Methanofastidiosum sp.]|nr:SHOCT domain-containing protein [Methanofastidiosum sp.]